MDETILLQSYTIKNDSHRDEDEIVVDVLSASYVQTKSSEIVFNWITLIVQTVINERGKIVLGF